LEQPSLGAYLIVKNNNKPKPEVQKVVKTVFTETAKNGTVPIVIPTQGNLIAKNRLELFAEVQGVFQYSAHDFKAGQSYRKGETLMVCVAWSIRLLIRVTVPS